MISKLSVSCSQAFYNPYFSRDEACPQPLTNVNLVEIYKSSRLVSSITGMLVQANKVRRAAVIRHLPE